MAARAPATAALARRSPVRREIEPERHALLDGLIAALPHGEIGWALQVGCSPEPLAGLLARRCAALLAIDGDGRRVRRVRHLIREQPHVRTERCDLPDGLPAGPFGLVVCGEDVLGGAEPEALLRRIERCLRPGGSLVAGAFEEADRGQLGRLVDTHTRLHPAGVDGNGAGAGFRWVLV